MLQLIRSSCSGDFIWRSCRPCISRHCHSEARFSRLQGFRKACATSHLTDSTDVVSADQRPQGVNGALQITAKELEKICDTDGDKRAVAAELGALLACNLETGLLDDQADLERRRERYGSNVLPEPKSKSFAELALEALDDFTLRVLMASGALSFALSFAFEKGEGNGWIDGVAILSAVFVVVAVSATTNYQRDQQFQALAATERDVQVRVRRGGNECSILMAELVVGDILLLEAGDVVAADGALVDGFDVRCDESHLTGEADDVLKAPDGDAIVFSGSKVVSGYGSLLVLAVGLRSQQGKILNMTQQRGLKMPGEVEQQYVRSKAVLEDKLEDLAGTIGRLGAAAATLTFVIQLSTSLYTRASGGVFTLDYARSVVDYVINAVTILVVAVPEGLPLAVTMALAFSVKRMLSDNNLVRHLYACETMGTCTSIASDKTGTLTQNRMQVTRGWVAGAHIDKVPRMSADDLLDPDIARLPREVAALSPVALNALKTCIAVNSTATLDRGPAAEAGGSAIRETGNRTECALLRFACTLGTDIAAEREATRIVAALPFSSDRKRMSVLVQQSPGGGEGLCGPKTAHYTLFCKGAAEVLLCNGHISTVRFHDSSVQLQMTAAVLTTFGNVRLRQGVGGVHAGTNSHEGCCLCCGVFGRARCLSHKPTASTLSQIMLSRCSSHLTQDGSTRLLSREQRRELLRESRVGGLRLMALAYRHIHPPAATPAAAAAAGGSGGDAAAIAAAHAMATESCQRGVADQALENELTLVAVLGIRDNVRPEVPDAVRQCQKAGITVRMLTGDHRSTAAMVALECGILSGDMESAMSVVSQHGKGVHTNGARAPATTPTDGRAQAPAPTSAERPDASASASPSDRMDASTSEPRSLQPNASSPASSLSDQPPELQRPTTPTQLSAPSTSTTSPASSVTSPRPSDSRRSAAHNGTAPDSEPSAPRSAPATLNPDDPACSVAALPPLPSIPDGAYVITGSCGEQQLVMNGEDFRRAVLGPDGAIDQAAFNAIWPRLRVLARCSPMDKFVIIQGCQAYRLPGGRRDIVAMTGDGTNDAPALRLADVGFAMRSGTSIARQASDIILMDDNFNSIVQSVKWGRNVYASIIKFLQFQLTINVVAVVTAVVGVALLASSPLTPVQMLWVNMIMDSLASLSLATENPTGTLLNMPPFSSETSLLTPIARKHIVGQVIYQLIVMGGLIVTPSDVFGLSNAEHMTLIFNSFVVIQLFNQVACRKAFDEPNIFEGLLDNRIFLGVLSAEAVLQGLIVQYGGPVFNTVPLPPRMWLLSIGLGLCSWAVRQSLARIPTPKFEAPDAA